jgi:hypothetical protein
MTPFQTTSLILIAAWLVLVVLRRSNGVLITGLLVLAAAPIIPNPDGPPPPPMRQGITLGAIANSYLYLGPRSSLTRSTANPAVYQGNEPYLSELHRRLSVYGFPFSAESLLTEGDPRYFTD